MDPSTKNPGKFYQIFKASMRKFAFKICILFKNEFKKIDYAENYNA